MTLARTECLDWNGGYGCRGPVEYRTVGRALTAWPRCEAHFKARLRRYENSIERYADSDVPPSWFDPAAAGERWDDEW